MIRIFFGLIILACFISLWTWFMFLMRDKQKGWFWGASGSNHFVSIVLSIIITAAVMFGLAQPMAFLKYIFG